MAENVNLLYLKMYYFLLNKVSLTGNSVGKSESVIRVFAPSCPYGLPQQNATPQEYFHRSYCKIFSVIFGLIVKSSDHVCTSTTNASTHHRST